MNQFYQTQNKFLTSKHFVSLSSWKDLGSGFILWPSMWAKIGMKPSVEVDLNSLYIGFGFWRLQLNLGKHSPVDMNGPIDWQASGLDQFLTWAKKSFMKNWSRGDLDRLFSKEPRLRVLVLKGGAKNHYVRIMLAREIAKMAKDEADFKAGVGQDMRSKGVGSGVGSTDVKNKEDSGPDSESETGSKSFLLDLTALESKIKRKEKDD